MSISLTDQQQTVIDHNLGPALVFAVAGAGKTTAMVHRIERLVREEVFSPERILATSFGKENERDLRRSLQQWSYCRKVRISTLHALGNDIIRTARTNGLLAQPTRREEKAGLDHAILNLALIEARNRNVHYKREIDGLDRQDFLDYLGHCKNRLAYAQLDGAALPASAGLATQAEPPSETLGWYLPLYRLYETVRTRNRWITFDDMLMTGWELLHRHSDLLAEMQNRHDCVIVDEFQDINLAQSEILELLTQPHRNYMAVGDDDQTIYEWRGATPEFILDFPRRYSAETYLISDNFRCPAQPLVIANTVIARNQQRQPKRLNLTKGFSGSADSHSHTSIDEMATAIVKKIEDEAQQGRPLKEIAVLVRLNAQTPPIEQKLIMAEIPYRVSKPFYERPEIKVLIAYCRLGWLDTQLKQGKKLGPMQRQVFESAWSLVHNRPKRYIGRDLRESIRNEVVKHGRPLCETLRIMTTRIDRDYLIDKLESLAFVIEWLGQQLNKPAHQSLKLLDIHLNYQNYLRDSTGSVQTGEGRATSVAAFIEYAKDKGSLAQFMRHIRELAEKKIGRTQSGENVVTLSTIHMAKGLEWPVVIIPNCNQGIMPFTDMFSAEINWKAHMEEERRLFYVAVTRTMDQLHLHRLSNEAQSQFLNEAYVIPTTARLAKLRTALARDPAVWRKRSALAARDCRLVIQEAKRQGLERYFELYWNDDVKREIIGDFVRVVSAEKLARDLEISKTTLKFWLKITPNTDTSNFPGVATLKPDSRIPTNA